MPFVDADDAMRWLSDDVPTLVIAGAGVSMAEGTWAPGVRSVLEPTLQMIADAAHVDLNALQDPDLIQRVFPEVVYGAVAEASGKRDVLRVWSVLNSENVVRAGSVPSVGHRAIVQLCSQRGWPVITTNFDPFFELAARASSVPASVTVLDPGARSLRYHAERHRFDLLKVHGTADSPLELRSTVSDLSQCARAIERIAFTPAPRRVLVVGYSGRDFDLFPWVFSNYRGDDVLWVDRRFDSDHRALVIGANCFQGSWDDLGGRICAPFPPRADKDVVTKRYQRAIEEALASHLKPEVDRPGVALAAFVGLCAAAGAHRDAASLVSRAHEITAPDTLILTLLWGAHANSSLDRFKTARLLVRNARAVARRHRMWRARGRCAVADTYARTSNLWLQVVPEQESGLWYQARRLMVLVHVLADAVLWGPAAFASMRRLRPAERRPVTFAVSDFRFCADYLEHLIRMMAFVQALAGRVPAFQGPVARAWSGLARLCSSIGYTWGVFNVSKYVSRVTGQYETPTGAVTAAGVMGDRVGACIAHRDAALRLVENTAPAPSSDDLVRALKLVNAAVAQATALNCPSLLLKAFAVRRRIDPHRVEDRATVERLIDRAECDSIHRQKHHIVRALCG